MAKKKKEPEQQEQPKQPEFTVAEQTLLHGLREALNELHALRNDVKVLKLNLQQIAMRR